MRHGRCEVFPSRQRISTALAKTRAKDRRRALVSGTCAYACMWRYILLCLGKVVDIESEVGSGWGFENLCWGMRLGFVMGSSWACKYLRVMTGVAVISLPVRALVAGCRKQEKILSEAGSPKGVGAMGCCRSRTKTAVAGEPKTSSEICIAVAVGCCSSRAQTVCGSHKICIQNYSPRLDRANESLVWWRNQKQDKRTDSGSNKSCIQNFRQDSAERMTVNDSKIFGPSALVYDNQDSTGL